MAHLDFHIDGLSQTHERRWCKRASAHNGARMLLWSIVGAGAISVLSAPPAETPIGELVLGGVIPSQFSRERGQFHITVAPLDPDGELITRGFTVKDFSFSKLTVVRVGDSADADTTSAEAKPVRAWIRRPGGSGAALRVVLLLDNSGSMSDSAVTVRDAARTFVTAIGANADVAVAVFAERGWLLDRSFGDQRSALEAVNAYDASDSQGTPLYQALLDAVEHLSKETKGERAIVVLTDGNSDENGTPDLNTVIRNAKDRVRVSAIGLGKSIHDDLRTLASKTHGTYLFADDASELAGQFRATAISVEKGSVVVEAEVNFKGQPLEPGRYLLSGKLMTRRSGVQFPTAFDFEVEVPD